MTEKMTKTVVNRTIKTAADLLFPVAKFLRRRDQQKYKLMVDTIANLLKFQMA